jgi:RHS repeat-associated protein
MLKRILLAGNATGTFYSKQIDGSTLAETDLGENPTAVYGPVRGQIYHRVDISGTTYSPHYYFHDFLRSTNLVVNSSNAIQQETDYYPYGGEIPIISGDSNRYRFTGKEHDAETGLDFFGARHYASTMGRFMTPDWAERPTAVPYAHYGNPQSLNLYTYVQNNPTTVGDPDGHDGGGPDASWQTDPKAQANGVAQNAAAATVAAPTTLEEIDAVVKPLVDSAVSAGEKAGSAILDAGETALGAVAFVLTAGVGKTADDSHDKLKPETDTTGSPEPAAASGGAGARQGGSIDGFTKHGLNQAISRDGVGVSNPAMLDAVKNPTQVVQQPGGRTMYVGKDATVVMNSQGKVITTWANGSAGQR